MGAKKMGFFTREEFKQGFTELGVATLAGLKKALPGLEVRLKDPQAFHEFYGFAFSFCLTVGGCGSASWRVGGGTKGVGACCLGAPPPSFPHPSLPPHLPPHSSHLQDPGQKIIDVDTAAQMLQLAMPQGRFVKQFSEFLLSQTVGVVVQSLRLLVGVACSLAGVVHTARGLWLWLRPGSPRVDVLFLAGVGLLCGCRWGMWLVVTSCRQLTSGLECGAGIQESQPGPVEQLPALQPRGAHRPQQQRRQPRLAPAARQLCGLVPATPPQEALAAPGPCCC